MRLRKLPAARLEPELDTWTKTQPPIGPETPPPPGPDADGSRPEGAVPRLLTQVAAFNYVTVQNAPTYRALMQVFYDAKQHYIIELRPPEILERVRQARSHVEVASEEELDYPLGQLVEWGLRALRRRTGRRSNARSAYGWAASSIRGSLPQRGAASRSKAVAPRVR